MQAGAIAPGAGGETHRNRRYSRERLLNPGCLPAAHKKVPAPLKRMPALQAGLFFRSYYFRGPRIATIPSVKVFMSLLSGSPVFWLK